jgi:hypothetical protein
LNYAVKNRREWEVKGREFVADLITQATKISVNTRSERKEVRRQVMHRLLSARRLDVGNTDHAESSSVLLLDVDEA